MKFLIKLIKRSVFVILPLIITFQLAKATTVSQVLNGLHRQNFSQATLSSVEHLLDRFVDEDDRLNDNIASRSVDRRRLKKTLFEELKRAHGDEFCRAISHVQHILNLNGQSRNVAGPMRIVESFSDDIDVHNVNLFFRRMKIFLRAAVYGEELLWIWRILAKNMNDQEVEHCILQFLDEADSENFFQMHAPFQEVLEMMQGIIDKDDECQKLVDWPLISLVYPLMQDVRGFFIYEESLDSVIWLARHDIRNQSAEVNLAIRKIVDRVLEYCGDYREARDADMPELERFIKKLVMRLIIADLHCSKYKGIRKCFCAYMLYLSIFSRNTIADFISRKNDHDYYFPGFTRFQKVLKLCLTDRFLEGYNSDFSKKIYPNRRL